MDSKNVYEKIIQELNLEKNKRMAVMYFENLGDFYSLCTAAENAAKSLGIEVIILYSSAAHRDIIGWFEYGSCYIQSHKISEEEFSLIRYSNQSEMEKYQDYIISWNFGNREFRMLTRNNTKGFEKYLKKPRISSEKIYEKYREYIVPGKTVLIVPESRSVHSFPIWFWIFAAYIFETMGLSVVFNALPEKGKIYNGKCLLVPVSDIINFANECGFVMGVRTGLFDILSNSTAKMTIFSTKHYRPLDQAYNIENTNERIRTVYYCDNDPFFSKTDPISFVQNAFDYNFQPVRQLLNKLCKKDMPVFAKEYSANIIKAYSCTTIFNKYRVGRPGTDIEPFGNVMYSLDIINGKLAFSISNLSMSEYRFDYKIFCGEKLLTVFNDFRSNCISYPLEQSGEYYIEAIITDLSNYNQEFFQTHRVTYAASSQTALEQYTLCNFFSADLFKDAYNTIKSLEKTNLGLEKQIDDMRQALINANELRDKIDKLNEQCLLLSEQKTQLEKKLLQTEHLADEQIDSFNRQREKLLFDLDGQRAEIKELNSFTKNASGEIKRLSAENKSLEERAAFFENSRSWRITKPLRLFAAFIRKLFNGNIDKS